MKMSQDSRGLEGRASDTKLDSDLPSQTTEEPKELQATKLVSTWLSAMVPRHIVYGGCIVFLLLTLIALRSKEGAWAALLFLPFGVIAQALTGHALALTLHAASRDCPDAVLSIAKLLEPPVRGLILRGAAWNWKLLEAAVDPVDHTTTPPTRMRSPQRRWVRLITGWFLGAELVIPAAYCGQLFAVEQLCRVRPSTAAATEVAMVFVAGVLGSAMVFLPLALNATWRILTRKDDTPCEGS